MKSALKMILATLICFIVVTLIGKMSKDEEVIGKKTLHVKIVDAREEEKVILEDDFETKTTKLKDFLIELKEDHKIQLEYQDGSYGMYITGMGKDTLIHQDETNGYYWSFDSLNNAQCVKDTYCSGAEKLVIADGDEFVFKLADY